MPLIALNVNIADGLFIKRSLRFINFMILKCIFKIIFTFLTGMYNLFHASLASAVAKPP